MLKLSHGLLYVPLKAEDVFRSVSLVIVIVNTLRTEFVEPLAYTQGLLVQIGLGVHSTVWDFLVRSSRSSTDREVYILFQDLSYKNCDLFELLVDNINPTES